MTEVKFSAEEKSMLALCVKQVISATVRAAGKSQRPQFAPIYAKDLEVLHVLQQKVVML